MAVAVVVAWSVAGCGNDTAAVLDPAGDSAFDPDPVHAGASTSEEPLDVVARPDLTVVDASVVRILGFGCGAPALGSGFAIDTNLIVTSGHIVAGRDTDSLAVMRPSGEEYPAVIVGFDPDLDLAILRIDDATFAPVNLVTTVPRVDGVAVGVRSEEDTPYLDEIEFTVDAPVNVNWDGIYRDTDSRYRGLRIEAEVVRGDSGSGLFINDRDVIGLIHSTNRAGLPRAYAVGAIEIAEFAHTIDPAVEVAADRCA